MTLAAVPLAAAAVTMGQLYITYDIEFHVPAYHVETPASLGMGTVGLSGANFLPESDTSIQSGVPLFTDNLNGAQCVRKGTWAEMFGHLATTLVTGISTAVWVANQLQTARAQVGGELALPGGNSTPVYRDSMYLDCGWYDFDYTMTAVDTGSLAAVGTILVGITSGMALNVFSETVYGGSVSNSRVAYITTFSGNSLTLRVSFHVVKPGYFGFYWKCSDHWGDQTVITVTAGRGIRVDWLLNRVEKSILYDGSVSPTDSENCAQAVPVVTGPCTPAPASPDWHPDSAVGTRACHLS